MNHHKPFYGKKLVRRSEAEYIQSLLDRYKKEPASEELKKKIWEELQNEKHLGNITIPFKVMIQKDLSGKRHDYIEILIDTRV